MQRVKLPDFIHCENEPKTGDFLHDQRQFIYCPKFLSLIELIPYDEIQILYPKGMPQKQYFYTSKHFENQEEYLLVIVQNNIEAANAILEIEYLQTGQQKMTSENLLDACWEYYKKYLIWEDEQFEND